jgi:hypothetical protein
MKKFLVAAAAVSALASLPAHAGDTRIHVGFYSPAPVYYQPAPVYYAPRVAYYAPPVAYYAPPRFVRYEPPCPRRYGYNNYRGHHRGHGWGNREYASAWNGPRFGYGDDDGYR